MINIEINPKYAHLKEAILDIPNRFNNEGKVIQDQRNVIKIMSLGDLVINVKSFKLPLFFNQFAYRYLRLSKAKRSFRYASKLSAMGIGTPEPVAYIEYMNLIGLQESFYISIQNEDCITFRDLLNKPTNEVEDILIDFTKFTYDFQQKGLVFIDHSPGNTLISKTDSGYNMQLVDLNRTRFQDTPIALEEGIDNFRRLIAPTNHIEVMAKEYARLHNAHYNLVFERMNNNSLHTIEAVKKREAKKKTK